MTVAGVILTVALAVALIGGDTIDPQAAERLRARGVELGFDLDHTEAVATFRESIAADPDNLAGYRLLAAALWSDALFQRGAITTDDFVGEHAASYRKNASNPELERAATELLRRTESATATLGKGSSIDLRYEVGAAYRFLSTLEGTIARSQWRSLGAARRAYREHQRVLATDPRRADAALTIGLYRYVISTMPAWSRIVARVAGLDGDRASGIRFVEQTAGVDGPMQASAMFSLVVIYNQQQRFDDALEVIHRLQTRFSKNRLLWLEAGVTELRAGRAADARASIEHGLRMLDGDTRPRAYGELARWHYHYGVALARLNQVDLAAQQFHTAMQRDALEWVHEGARAELARLGSRKK